jgi:hypothetical protein
MSYTEDKNLQRWIFKNKSDFFFVDEVQIAQDEMYCKNYRMICLKKYKVFAKIQYESLSPHANAAVQHYQAGFQSGKSTKD